MTPSHGAPFRGFHDDSESPFLVMFGLDIVTFKDLERHDELLAIAFVGKHDPYRPLAQHIAEIIRDGQSA